MNLCSLEDCCILHNNQNNFISGEIISVSAEIDNQSKSDIDKSTAKLVQVKDLEIKKFKKQLFYCDPW